MNNRLRRGHLGLLGYPMWLRLSMVRYPRRRCVHMPLWIQIGQNMDAKRWRP